MARGGSARPTPAPSAISAGATSGSRRVRSMPPAIMTASPSTAIWLPIRARVASPVVPSSAAIDSRIPNGHTAASWRAGGVTPSAATIPRIASARSPSAPTNPESPRIARRPTGGPSPASPARRGHEPPAPHPGHDRGQAVGREGAGGARLEGRGGAGGGERAQRGGSEEPPLAARGAPVHAAVAREAQQQEGRQQHEAAEANEP